MPPHFDDLIARYLEGRLVVFAGSGVSHAGGLPAWDGLIRQLITGANPSAIDPQALAEADAALARGDMTRALGAVQTTMSATAYGRAVARAVDDRGRPVPPLARAIADLAPTLHAVVTTNLDRFIERAFAGEWPCFTLPKLDLGQQRHYILQLHGNRTDRGSWVLSEHDYERLLHARPELQRFVEGLFCFHSLLFVGYGLRDPDFERICGHLRAASRNHAPQHFALVPERTFGPYERRRLAEAGIDLITYDDTDGSHAELLRLLGELSASRPTSEVALARASVSLTRGPVSDGAQVMLGDDYTRQLVAHPRPSRPRASYSAAALLAGLVAMSTLVAVTWYVAPVILADDPPIGHPVTLVQTPSSTALVSAPARGDRVPAPPSPGPPVEPAERPANAAPLAPTSTKPKRCPGSSKEQLILSLGRRPSGVDRAHRIDLALTFDAVGEVQIRPSPEDSPLWPAAKRRVAEFAALRHLRNCRLDATWDP